MKSVSCFEIYYVLKHIQSDEVIYFYRLLESNNQYRSHKCIDIGASANLELVDKFSYLGDMLSVDGDADAAVEARIRIGWYKFRKLVPLLTNMDTGISLIMTGGLYL